MRREIPWFKIAAAAALLVLAGVIVLLVRSSQQLPDDVQPIAWNREPCAHCQMLIGEPAHAAQLITQAGEVLSFDDPGCALIYLDERQPAIHRLWFHRAHGEGWLPAADVAFTTGGDTPMGFGLLAVERGTPGAIDLETAHRHLRTPAMPSAMPSAMHEGHR